jgi:ATP adenylyltransferase
METLFAPWRSEYIRGEKPAGCVLCRDVLRSSELVVCEAKEAYVIVNRYPYTGGHLMIVPFRHLRRISELTSSEREAIFSLMDLSVRVLTEAMKPEGFNIGINLGKAAGAGVDDHLHMHIVPRWSGDTNFMSVVGEVRVIPEDVSGTARELRPYFAKYLREVCG